MLRALRPSEVIYLLKQVYPPQSILWSAENIILFFIAVDRWAGKDYEVDRIDSAEHCFSTSSKVAVATVPTGLFETIVEEIQTLREMSVGLRENKVWFSRAGRHGFFTIKA
jgi:hypothetical protein